MTIDVTDATFDTEVLEQSSHRARRRRPVGAVVRSLPNARPDPRAGRSTPPTARSCWPRSTSTRTRASPRPSRSSRSRPCTRCRTARWSTASSGRCPKREVTAVRAVAAADADEQSRLAELIAAGDEGEPPCRRWRSSPATRTPIVALAELFVERRPTPTRRWRCSSASPRSRAHPPRRRGRPPRRRRPTTTTTPSSTALLERVKADDDARQQFVDILELMGPDDPRTADYRARLTPAAVLTPFGASVSSTDVPRIPSAPRGAGARSEEADRGRPVDPWESVSDRDSIAPEPSWSPAALAERARLWLRFVGPARLATGIAVGDRSRRGGVLAAAHAEPTRPRPACRTPRTLGDDRSGCLVDVVDRRQRRARPPPPSWWCTSPVPSTRPGVYRVPRREPRRRCASRRPAGRRRARRRRAQPRRAAA